MLLFTCLLRQLNERVIKSTDNDAVDARRGVGAAFLYIINT